ncbi:Bacterial lipid A biosynthesis acyltransferase superfamily [Anopheles sinensis]|uniref:Bacterial lipid A biosynthesis acyltransferase superfamily n=1 Tax=Anopheles sinensis TaxID=74873 RepID=A0A084WC12_ANOSI|nr:Bacterial lipid A biosynthesis acyltransferase superfamily [Anopheles sinensis]
MPLWEAVVQDLYDARRERSDGGKQSTMTKRAYANHQVPAAGSKASGGPQARDFKASENPYL